MPSLGVKTKPMGSNDSVWYFAYRYNKNMGGGMKALLFLILSALACITNAADNNAFNYGGSKMCTDESCITTWVFGCTVMHVYAGSENSVAASIYGQLPGIERSVKGSARLYKSSKPGGTNCHKERVDGKDLYVCYVGMSLITDKPSFPEDHVSNDEIYLTTTNIDTGIADKANRSPFDGCYDESM